MTIKSRADSGIPFSLESQQNLKEERMKMIAFLNQRQGKLLKEVDNG